MFPRRPCLLLFALAASLSVMRLAQAADPVRILAYGDSNTWGWVPVAEAFPTTRQPADRRWPEVMRQSLGAGYVVVVDGLSARTTDADHIAALGVLSADRFNGLRDIDTAVARELPLDLVIVMLGSNDVAADLDRSPARIGEGAAALVRRIRGIDGGVATRYPAPQVLLVAPPPLGRMDRTAIGDRFDSGSVTKSRRLAAIYRDVARREGIWFFDAASVVPAMGGIDGIHLTGGQQVALGRALAAHVAERFPRPRPEGAPCHDPASCPAARLPDPAAARAQVPPASVDEGRQRIEVLLGAETRHAIEMLDGDLPITARATARAVGDIYRGDAVLDLKTRELVTVAMLATLGHAGPQLRLHVRGAQRAGASRAELLAVIDQLHAYAGIPAALNAAAIVRDELDILVRPASADAAATASGGTPR